MVTAVRIYEGTEIVGVTATSYPKLNDPRFEISLDTAERWRDANLPLVIVDGSPVSENGKNIAKDAYRRRGAIVLDTEIPGIATQRQRAARYVLSNGGDKILTHEPEKPSTPSIARDVANLLDANSIVVVGRTEASKKTMPPVQLRTENLAGWILEQTLDLPADALAGPRGYNRDGIQHLIAYPSHVRGMNNWIYMYHNPLEARAAGEKVVGILANLSCPEDMVRQETDDPVFDRKRYEQFRLQLEYLLVRPEVNPRAAKIVGAVLDGFGELPDNPTNIDYETYFTNLEAQLTAVGYRH